MTSEFLLSSMESHGIKVIADGDNLKLQGDAGALTPEVIETARQHKRELLRLLSSPNDSRHEPAKPEENGITVDSPEENWTIGDEIPWDELPKPLACPVCGETVLDCWWDGLDRQRCRLCDPPWAAKGSNRLSGPRNGKRRTETG